MNMNDVAKPTAQHGRMDEDWRIIDALMGGTRAMREAGELYLPRRPAEEPEDYKRRLSLSTLFPALSETVGNLTGRAFASPLTYDGVPEWVESEVLPDVDLEDRNLTAFAGEWFRRGLALGVMHVLVDAPTVRDGDGRPMTREQQRAARLRPYAVLVHPRRVLGWQQDRGVLTQLRVAFVRQESNGAWGTRDVEQVRVFEPGLVRVFEQTGEAKEWAEVEVIETDLDRIPLATFYTGRTGFMTAAPPLRELAHLNLKYWRLESAKDDLMEVASVPILALIGADGDDKLVVGGRYAVRLPRDGDLRFVEHSGAAIKAGRDNLGDLRDAMRQARAKLLETGAMVTKTASQSREDAAVVNSPLAQMVADFEDSMAQALDLIAEYRGAGPGGRVKLGANLQPDLGADTMPALIQMANRGALSNATLFAEAQRRGMIRDDLSWQDEAELIGAEGSGGDITE